MQAGNSKNNLFSLEEIVSNYSLVLIDTSAIENYFERIGKPHVASFFDLKETERKLKELEDRRNFRIRLSNCLEKKMPIFVTSLVRKEYTPNYHYPYKKRIKNLDPEIKHHRKILDMFRGIKNAIEEKKELMSDFEEKERIFKLGEEEKVLYNSLYKKYEKLREEYGLSEVDFDLLISGATANLRGDVALLSNDLKGITPAWNYFLRKEGVLDSKFSFFARQELNGFKQLSLIY